MDALKTIELERYLRSLWGPKTRILRCVPIGKAAATGDPKEFG